MSPLLLLLLLLVYHSAVCQEQLVIDMFYCERERIKLNLERSDDGRTHCSKPYGVFPDFCDCQKYLICTNGQGYLARCTIGRPREATIGYESYFDPQHGTCEALKSCPQTGGLIRNETACGHYGEGPDVHGQISKEKAQSYKASICQVIMYSSFDPATSNDQTTRNNQEPMSSATANSVQPIFNVENFKQSCSSFFQCRFGKVFLLNCPGNMYFDTTKGYCVFYDELTVKFE